MENPNHCHSCGKEDVLYNCECGKLFCRYHMHIILHQCPFKYPIIHRLNTIENHNRCYVCHTKKQVLLFKCYCGGMFCSKHRYIDAHRCTFDHRSLERERLIQSLPLIVKDKVPNRI